VTATATDENGNTSEFSASAQVSSSTYPVTTTYPGTVIAGDPSSQLMMVGVTRGRWPVSTGVTVYVNATAIGGSAALQLDDEGMMGPSGCDDLRGDGLFFNCIKVPLSVAAGTYNLPVTVTDAQGRAASPTNIAVTVVHTTGTIMGTLQDGSGAIVPGANVTIRNTGTGVTTVAMTNGAGVFTFPNKDPGIYDIISPVSKTNIWFSGGTLNVGIIRP
jgi:hypothetical protein